MIHELQYVPIQKVQYIMICKVSACASSVSSGTACVFVTCKREMV